MHGPTMDKVRSRDTQWRFATGQCLFWPGQFVLENVLQLRILRRFTSSTPLIPIRRLEDVGWTL